MCSDNYSGSIVFQFSEIMKQQNKKAYEKAVAENLMIKIRCIRFIYMGLPRSGKTTFLLRILGDILNIFKANLTQQSSTGVAKDEGMAVTNWGITGKKIWSRIQNLNSVLSQFIDPGSNEHGDMPQKSASDGQENDGLDPPRDYDMGDVLSFLDEKMESKELDLVKDVLEDMTLMINTDTGGHAEFLDLHSSLVHGPSLNLLFSSLKDSLFDQFKVYYTDKDGNSTEPVDSDMTVEEVLFQALSSIACFGCSKKAEGGTSKVMFVGTHANKDIDGVSPEDFDKKDRLLQNTIKPTAFFESGLIKIFFKGSTDAES